MMVMMMMIRPRCHLPKLCNIIMVMIVMMMMMIDDSVDDDDNAKVPFANLVQDYDDHDGDDDDD